MENTSRTRESISTVSSQEPELTSQARLGSSPHILCLTWKPDAPDDPSVEFAASITSYLFGSCREILVETRERELLDDLDLDELVVSIRSGRVATITFRTGRVDLAGEWCLEITSSEATQKARCNLAVTVCDNEQSWTQVDWLQASFAHPSPIPVLAIPRGPGGVSVSVFHGLVVLAARFGRVDMAELERSEGSERVVTTARWHFDDPPEGAVPVIPHEGETLWLATATPPSAAAKAACWVEVVDAGMPRDLQMPVAPDLSWQDRFTALLAVVPPDSAELVAHLQQLAPVLVPFRIDSLSATPPLESMVPPQDGIVCRLVPTESVVHVGVDFDQDEDVIKQALLHAYGHLLLGHVRPGDPYGHWDTAETLGAVQPHRRWDREVREQFSVWFQSTAVRQVASLDDCTPLEKAQLGLWRMIGEMLGESRRLHPLAERYQKAAYQRQAAQRMVAMLEDYGGAMLCDGVGLGKTYVATTLMVHDVNTWQDQHAADPESVRTDPFRITVLAPNSVVSTWRREAIPPLSAFGVPLATVRVVSHTKLSRLTRASELLQHGARDTLSDLEHLLLSDLVIVDEAHNFRSVAARRTRVLRDLLRLQPRREARRRVVLLTATPVNNSLEDLRQEAGLLFSRPLWLSDARTDDGYRRQAIREVQDRCARARRHRAPQGDVAPLVIHGQAEARFSDTIEFRDDLDFGPNVQRISDYLKEQDDKLKVLQDDIRAAARAGAVHASADGPVRIAEELLDRIVVQRSRALCKEIERQQGSNVELLFRPDQGIPEKLYYADEYDGTGFSSLDTIEACPLQWQLIHSAYGDLPRFPARPHPAAVEGEIVHQVLDLLFKGLALAGLPAIGSAAFRTEIARINVQQAVAERVSDYYDCIADHPRCGGFRLRVDTQQLVNRVIRLFRAEYAKAVTMAGAEPQSSPVMVTEELSGEALLSLLSSRGALSELRLAHPSVPFVGIIDLVRLGEDGVSLVDFKTGEPKSAHRQQLMLYAVLWWRRTGQVPAAIEARYPSHMATFSVSTDDLHIAEEGLRSRIDALTGLLENPPAVPRPGDQCRYCDVRQFCNAYWENGLKELPTSQAKQNEQKSIDIELTVRGQPAATGFEAQSRSSRLFTVVHSADGWKVHGPFIDGESLRILNTRLAENGDILELMPWTEVFHR